MKSLPLLALIMITGIHFYSLLTHRENWPLTRYPMYSTYLQTDQVEVYKAYEHKTNDDHHQEVSPEYFNRRRFSANLRRAFRKNQLDEVENEIEMLTSHFFAHEKNKDLCLTVKRLKGWPIQVQPIRTLCNSRQ